MRARSIAVVAYDGISPFHLSVPGLVFGEDRREAGVPRYDVRVCAVSPGMVETSAGYGIKVRHSLDMVRDARTVMVPSWCDPARSAPDGLLRALRRAHSRGARIVGLCLGAFVLADAGLLDGRRATTHWRWADLFARRFPRVQLDPAVLYVEDGAVLTSAGTAASIDCCLHLLRSDVGAELAARVARRLVMPLHRRGGQAQYIEQPIAEESRTGRLTKAAEWAVAHLDQRPGTDMLADRAAMSRRNFTRRFRDAYGTSVHRWLLEQRVNQARRLLETTDASIERIAAAVGFGTPLALRLNFARRVGTSPTEYRKAFDLRRR
jgi:transcriptional regulator GlxA family with amidase domain